MLLAPISAEVKLAVGDEIKVCYRFVSAENPYDPEVHKKPLTCEGMLKAEKAPYGAGLTGASIAAHFKGMSGVQKIRALSVKAGQKPSWRSSSIQIKDKKNEFFDNYITEDEKGKKVMYFHLEK